jgi:cell division protein FtsI (penicillin-binding protein 3)
VVSRGRLYLLIAMVVLASGMIGARLYQLQVVGCEQFRSRAVEQHQAEFTVQAKRGSILDRGGRELAVSLESASLFAHPWKVDDPGRAARLLAPVLGESRRKLERRLRSDQPFVYLRRFLDAERKEAVLRLDLPVGPGHPFGFESEPKRVYPRGRLAVHVLGCATIDGDGVEGLELRFDDLLQGDPTIYLAVKDARNGRLRELLRAPEKESQDLVLSIDLVLQHIVERELDRAMRSSRARAATAIVVDPASGELLALANRPAADPNAFGDASPRARANRAVVHSFEPGSTFKFVPMAAALERGTVSSRQSIHCENGVFTVGRRQIHDTSPHAWLTPRQIFAKSSNIGMVKVARTLSPTGFSEMIARFGFGARTGVELPGESKGQVRPVSTWSAYSQASMAFGQEIAVTPLQLVTALAAIANDGVLVPPRVALGTRDARGGLRLFAKPRPRRVVSAEVARELRSMLESVIQGGTGRRAAIGSYRLAGKSGTAQKAVAGGYSETEFMASFGGFGPVDRPRLAALVVLDTPAGDLHQGGQVAAPVFGRIMDAALRHLRIPGTEDRARWVQTAEPGPGPEWSRPPSPAPLTVGKVPDVRGMSLREAVARLSAYGCLTLVEGTGRVTGQRPPPGAELPSGGRCVVRAQSRPASRRSAG